MRRFRIVRHGGNIEKRCAVVVSGAKRGAGSSAPRVCPARPSASAAGGAEKGHLGSCSPRVPTEELEKNYPGETNRSPRGDLRPGTQHRGGSPDSQFICGVETGQEVYYNVICAASVSNELHLPGGSLNYSVK